MPEKKSNDNPSAPQSAEKNARAINETGEALYLSGSKEEALAQFKEAIELDSQCVHAYNNIGVYYWDTGNLAASIDWFQKALKIKPDDMDTLNNLETILQIINHERSMTSSDD